MGMGGWADGSRWAGLGWVCAVWQPLFLTPDVGGSGIVGPFGPVLGRTSSRRILDFSVKNDTHTINTGAINGSSGPLNGPKPLW